jgi:hypothetical protein
MPVFQHATTARIAGFLEAIGLTVRCAEFPDGTFLPGLQSEQGTLVVFESKLLYPGDLLLEAGHFAVLPADQRGAQGPDAGAELGNEIAAISWSYAAAVHIGLDPAVVFHAHGYRGASQAYLDNFSEGRYVGVPLLQWMGLTADEQHAPALGVKPYPHMLRWLRE